MPDSEDDLRQAFDDLCVDRYPFHRVEKYSGTIFEYIIGNVQAAVADEIILMMETWLSTMREAMDIPKFLRTTDARDWEVGISHVQELISEVRQYRTRGTHAHHSTHTGEIHLEKDD